MWVDYRVCTRRIHRLIDTLEYSVRDERRILVDTEGAAGGTWMLC